VDRSKKKNQTGTDGETGEAKRGVGAAGQVAAGQVAAGQVAAGRRDRAGTWSTHCRSALGSGGATMGDSSIILLMVAGVGRTADGGVRDLSGTGAGRPPRYTRVRR
jgi:hypothetical protein